MKWIGDFISLIYPRLCCTCGRHLLKEENYLCFICLNDLPYTGYLNIRENAIYEIFQGRIQIKQAASWLHFERGNKTQMIMHELKYRSNPEIGNYLGEKMGLEMKKSLNFEDVDAIVPVPIHKNKKRQRGYNQSDFIAQGIGYSLNQPVFSKDVERRFNSQSQTRKRRYERWENVHSAFIVRSGFLNKCRHVLLVDDVITTGATIESLAHSLLSVRNLSISVVTLARSG